MLWVGFAVGMGLPWVGFAVGMGLPSVWVCRAWVHREFVVPGLGVGLPCLGSPWVCRAWARRRYGLPWVLGEHSEENRNEEREKRNEEREKKLK